MSDSDKYIKLDDGDAELKYFLDTYEVGYKFWYPTIGNQADMERYEIVADAKGMKHLINLGRLAHQGGADDEKNVHDVDNYIDFLEVVKDGKVGDIIHFNNDSQHKKKIYKIVMGEDGKQTSKEIGDQYGYYEYYRTGGKIRRSRKSKISKRVRKSRKSQKVKKNSNKSKK
jgi:hypothetical protein